LRDDAKRDRILLCGTNYGRRYLEAIERERERYALAGIVARGSLRSTLLAAQYGVPLYLDAADVPDGIDASVAAMGSPDGDEVVLQLLRRGIPVLCEHPVRPAFVTAARAAAAASGAVFHVNAHFSSLEAPRAFIRSCLAAREREQPLFLDAALTPRLLYAFADVIGRAIGPLLPVEIDRVMPPGHGWFTTLSGTLAGIASTLQFERLRPDGSAQTIVDCRIAAGFPSGILTLVSLAGPVIRSGNARRAAGPLSETVFSHEGITRQELDAQRLDAIAGSLASLLDEVRGGTTPPDQTAEQLLDVSGAAETLREHWLAAGLAAPAAP
jgi:thiazolinyl imide reductase